MMLSSIFENDIGMSGHRSLFDRIRGSGHQDDFELDLEMSDLLEEFEEVVSETGEQDLFAQSGFDLDIFADNDPRQCKEVAENTAGPNQPCGCGKKKAKQHDYAMDSTFISLHQTTID